MTCPPLTLTSVILQTSGGMIFCRYASTALASPFIAFASLCDMQLDVGYVLPPTMVVPTHWPAWTRSAACADRARQVNTSIERTVTERLVFIFGSLLNE